MKNKIKAFTLVELIVVITILAILGTIAFISLQWYSAWARDSKRVSNINELIKNVNIKALKWTWLETIIVNWNWPWTTATDISSNLRINNTWAILAEQWAINFLAIQEDGSKFKDNWNDYRFSYALGWSGSWTYKFLQIATRLETDNTVKLIWNYYKFDTENDYPSIIALDPTNISSSADMLENEQELPVWF